MDCNFTSSQHPEFFVSLTVNAGGVLVTLLCIICVASNPFIEATLRGILLSFSIANVMGTIMLTYDTIALLCNHGDDQTSGFVITITVMLSVSHLTLLLLFEYLNLKSRSERRVKDFMGLIIISWIISVTVGSMNVGTMHHEARLIFATTISTIFAYILLKYFLISAKQNKKKKLQEAFKLTFLKESTKGAKVAKCHWDMRCMTMTLVSYVACSVPWVINEFREGLGDESEVESKVDLLMHSCSLVLYSVNFYFPSLLCIYLRYKQYISKKNRTPRSRATTYRYRDTFS